MAATHEIEALMIRIVADNKDVLKKVAEVETAFGKLRGVSSGHSGGGLGGGRIGGGRGGGSFRHPEVLAEENRAKELLSFQNRVNARVRAHADEQARINQEVNQRSRREAIGADRQQRQAEKEHEALRKSDRQRIAGDERRAQVQQRQAAREHARLEREQARSQREQARAQERRGFLGAGVKSDRGTFGTGMTGTMFAGAAGGAAMGFVTSTISGLFSLASSVASAVSSTFMSFSSNIVDFTSQAVKAYSDLEQAQVTFSTMLASEEKGSAVVAQLQQIAAVAPVSKYALQQATQMLLSFGVSGQNVIPVVKMLAEVSGGNADRMQRLAKAFADVTSIGRLMGREVIQFTNAGFNPLEFISKRTGKSMDQLRKDMQQGMGPSIAQVTQALVDATSAGGRFHGLLDKMSKTIAGSWRMAGSQVLIAMQQVGQGIASGFNLRELGTSLAEGIRDVGIPAAQQLGKTIAAFAPAWNQVRDTAKAAWEWMRPVRQSLFELFVAIEKNALVLWNAVFRGAMNMWNGLVKATGTSWGSIRTTVVNTIDTLTFTVEKFEKYAGTLWDDLGYKTQAFFKYDLPKYVLEGILEVGKVVVQYGTIVPGIVKSILGETKTEKAERELAVAQAHLHFRKMIQMRKDFDKWVKDRAEAKVLRATATTPTAIDVAMQHMMSLTNALIKATPPALDSGEKINDKIKEITHSLQVFDAASYGSAEALSRIFAGGRMGISRLPDKEVAKISPWLYDPNEPGARHKGPPMPEKPFVPPPAWELNKDEAAHAGEKPIDIWKRIEVLLKTIADKDSLNVDGSDLDL